MSMARLGVDDDTARSVVRERRMARNVKRQADMLHAHINSALHTQRLVELRRRAEIAHSPFCYLVAIVSCFNQSASHPGFLEALHA